MQIIKKHDINIWCQVNVGSLVPRGGKTGIGGEGIRADSMGDHLMLFFTLLRGSGIILHVTVGPRGILLV